VVLTIPRAMSALIAALAGLGMAAVVAADAPPGAADLEGFSSAAAAAEMQLEQRFDSDLSAADLRSWLEQMSSAPNHVGSPHDKANAEFELAKFKEWGWDASIETFSVLYPTPKEVSVELVAPTHFTYAVDTLTRGAATPAYKLPVEEAFMVLDGVLDVETFDAAGAASVQRLGARDLALIAPGMQHRLVNRDAATVRFGAIAGSKDAVPVAWREAVAAR